jgi:pimeloyl-ACP methyl ester carboxylesterase
VADVEVGPPSAPVAAPPHPGRLEQRIRIAHAPDGVRVAYATVGEGAPLVRAAHWVTHLDYEWESPVWRHWMEGLSRGRMFVRYDERGCGLSDHDPEDISFEAFVRDLETVVDELGLERFPLMGLSQGGPVAVEYAVRHPERVSRLILVGAFVVGRLARAQSEDERREAEMQGEFIRLGWGRDDPSFRLYFSSTFMPDAPPQLWSDFAALMRRTTSAENALRLNNVSISMDVRERAKLVTAPTLILHGRNEVRIPFSQALEFASLIPGSRLVPLDTRNHLLHPGEPAWEHLLREIDAFLAEDEPT